MITAQQAYDLAIVYDAINRANDKEDRHAKALWAEKLLELQQATGVKLHPEWVLKFCIQDVG
jgi:hypothetical protein